MEDRVRVIVEELEERRRMDVLLFQAQTYTHLGRGRIYTHNADSHC